MSQSNKTIKTRERQAIIASLSAGVTPRTGLQHIQVGRKKEIMSVVKDLETIVDGGSIFRLVIGEYGSGKSFFLQLMKTIALEKGLVVVSADLSPDRRLYASQGQARNLYKELMKNISTRTKPDGNGLVTIVEKFINHSREIADAKKCDVSEVIDHSLKGLKELVGGYDFATVIDSYSTAYERGNEQTKDDAVRWLRGEFNTKTDAMRALNVRSIVDDFSVYDYLKLMSLFVKKAGYEGLLINIDEMVNLYKLVNSQSRTSNYEQLLRILNDCLQGSAANMGFLLGGTPEFLNDTRRGLHSYEALKSRLAENRFSQKTKKVDYNSPVLGLDNLTPEELYILLHNLRHVFAGGEKQKYLLPDEALREFLNYCANHLGDYYFKTPRNTIKEFIHLLSQIEQYPDSNWKDLIATTNIAKEEISDMRDIYDDDDEGLKSFKI